MRWLYFFDGDADPEFCKGIIYCCGIRATLKCTNGEFSCSLGGQYRAYDRIHFLRQQS